MQNKRAVPAGFLATALQDYSGYDQIQQQIAQARQMKRKPSTKHSRRRSKEPKIKQFCYKELNSLDGLGKQMFPVFADEDVFGYDLPQSTQDGRETIIDSTQDDDVESNSSTVKAGKQTTLKDLLVVKDWLKMEPSRVRKNLKTFKLWAPFFGG